MSYQAAANARRRNEAISLVRQIFNNEDSSLSDRLIYLDQIVRAAESCVYSIRDRQVKESESDGE